MKKDNYGQKSLKIHKKTAGKIEVCTKGDIKNMDDMSVYYTPGIAAVSQHVKNSPKRAREYTLKKNAVAVISDGSSVLGLGNIGPYGALPVMGGKAMIFKEFAGVDAYPIVLDTQDVDEVVMTIKNIAPGFGGINLEDFGAPNCFEIEERLQKELNIPVMHDDQHGTAIVVLAGLINAAQLVKKDLKKMKIAIIGPGAAGTAIAKLLMKAGVSDIFMVDKEGILNVRRFGLSPHKMKLAKLTNREGRRGSKEVAIENTDVVIGVSGPKQINKAHIESMNDKPIVFALANPTPEIMPDEAIAAGAAVVATGRSDFPNQVNNALVFPGFFRGALDRGVNKINDDMKLRAAKALAGIIKKPTKNKIIPNIFDKKVMPAVAKSIKKS